MEQDWKIQVVGRDIKPEGNILVLESTLNQRPDPEWTPFMIHASVAKAGGSATFAFSQPAVTGNKVLMPIEDRDIEAAVSFIEASVSYANQRFESQVLAKRQREAEQKKEREATQAAQLGQARERLRKIGSPVAE